MRDRRTTLSNGRFADVALKGRVAAEAFVEPVARCFTANAWILDQPDGRRDRQALFGDAFSVVETRGRMAFGRLEKDGYVGWVPVSSLGPVVAPTHFVTVRTTWGWAEPDFKKPASVDLHMTSRVSVSGAEGQWAVVENGRLFVPMTHLSPIGHGLDVVDAARAFLGTPYVWAGNTGFGIDCSGLVQSAFHATGCACPPDSDLQEAASGTALATDARLEAGDLMFWKGHVALATGSQTLIHANAHHMSVVEEAIDDAVVRIAASETGDVTTRLRPRFGPLR